MSGVSFVITVYNKRPFLPAVIAGLAAQIGEFEREYIFIDDGSTDGSGAELERLTAGWPDVRIISQPNSGPSIATNRGLAAARLPLIKLVDGDDVLLPQATAQLRNLLLRHPEAVLAWGAGERYATPETAVRQLRAAQTSSVDDTMPHDALPALLHNCDLAPTACLVRAEIARRVGGCDERVFTQDYSLFLRLAANGPFARIAAPVFLAPEAPGSHINDGGPQVLHDINLALFFFLLEHDTPRKLARPAVRRALKRAWRWARRREKVSPFDRSFLLLLAGYVAAGQTSLSLLRESCNAFCLSKPVRRV